VAGDPYPQRIVCLTEEPTEVLYRLGEQARIVGISGFTVRPPEARREKPKVSAFTSARIDRILALQPDLAIGFSDIQADIARELIRAGVEVWISNHRSVEGILAYTLRLGAMVGAAARAEALVEEMRAAIMRAETLAATLPRRPRVYFEEWDEPLISGIRWVSELIAIAGGEDVFAERATQQSARERIIADPGEVIARQPDIVIGSWCGKHFRPERVAARAGWDAMPAVRRGCVHEIKSAVILTPGPVAIEEGLPALLRIFEDWAAAN